LKKTGLDAVVRVKGGNGFQLVIKSIHRLNSTKIEPMNRTLFVCLLLFAPPMSAIGQEAETAAAEAKVNPGIADSKPETGRFVALKDGKYMVPYQLVLPQIKVVDWPGPDERETASLLGSG